MEAEPGRSDDTLFRRFREGDAAARDEFFAFVYGELHRQARRQLGGQRRRHTLGASGVVQEVLLRLMNGGGEYADRSHFLAVAARSMRQVLVDHARRRRADKRRPPGERVELDSIVADYEERSIDLLALDEALLRLEQAAPVAARLVDLRFFAGQSVPDCADALGLSTRSAYRMLDAARTYLFDVLHGGDVAP